MSAEMDLHDIIYPAVKPWGGTGLVGASSLAAREILAAGYAKPRTITTIAELDALPEGSVILPKFGGRTWRRGLVSWDNGIYRWSSASLASHSTFPAAVLYEHTA
jgi:hypothetical protein